MKTLCAFTSICEEDACWVLQYLKEAERLNMPFVMHFDRCTESLIGWVTSHKLCNGWTRQDDSGIEFNEQHKQLAFDIINYDDDGFAWAMAWDIDETYAHNQTGELEAILSSTWDCIDVRWLNLWGLPSHIRTDSGFDEGHRVKFYNLQNDRKWKFDHPITNGAKLVGREATLGDFRDHFVCLHWGMMTQKLREQHKARWDRIYTKAVGANPYGFWSHALDPTIRPVLVKHGYFS